MWKWPNWWWKTLPPIHVWDQVNILIQRSNNFSWWRQHASTLLEKWRTLIGSAFEILSMLCMPHFTRKKLVSPIINTYIVFSLRPQTNNISCLSILERFCFINNGISIYWQQFWCRIFHHDPTTWKSSGVSNIN